MSNPNPPTPAEIAAALCTVVAAVDVARDSAGGDFAADSPAALDWTANEMPGEWGPQLLQDSYRTAEMYGASVRDHVIAMADAIDNGRTFAIVTLARALVEPAARACYLLQPDIEPLERVRRLVNDILYAAFEHETMWLDNSQVPNDSELLAKVGAEAQSRGLRFTKQVRTERKFTAACVGTARPATQRLLGHVTTPETAKFFYRAGSAVIHGALHGFDKRLIITGASPSRAVVAAVDSERVLLDCTFAIQVYVAYLGALMWQTGWPDAAVNEALDEADSVWQRIIESTSDTESQV